MTHIIFQGNEITLNPQETVLNALLRLGFDIPNSCQAGVCQNCLMHGEGEIPIESQKGLNPVQKELGQFLSCCCKPSSKLNVSLTEKTDTFKAQVLEKSYLSDDILLLRLSKEYSYRAGQFLTLFNPQGEGRCYSIASHSKLDDFIELHIRVVEGGKVSTWLDESVSIGDFIEITTPRGECFYTKEYADQTLFLCGIGTGFAPLYGILRDALNSGHRGDIYFLVGAKTDEGFYYQDVLPSLRNKQTKIHQVALEGVNTQSLYCFKADIYDYAKKFVPKMEGVKVYLCGAESFVGKMKKQCFLSGASMKDIYADAFIHSK